MQTIGPKIFWMLRQWIDLEIQSAAFFDLQLGRPQAVGSSYSGESIHGPQQQNSKDCGIFAVTWAAFKGTDRYAVNWCLCDCCMLLCLLHLICPTVLSCACSHTYKLTVTSFWSLLDNMTRI